METPSVFTFNLDGATRVFPIPAPIKGDNYCRIEIDGVVLNDRTKYDIVNNSIVFINQADVPAGSVLKVAVVQSEEAVGNFGTVTNVDRVGDNINNVNLVGNNIDDVVSVAQDLTNVDLVSADLSNIDTVSTNITDVNTTSLNIASINTVVADIANVDNVSSNITDVNAVSTNLFKIDSVYTNMSQINVVYSNMADVNNVSSISDKVVDVANNNVDISFLSDKIRANNGILWNRLVNSAQGSGDNEVFYQNDNKVTDDYIIPADVNSMSIGPIEIKYGVNVTVSIGSFWYIL